MLIKRLLLGLTLALLSSSVRILDAQEPTEIPPPVLGDIDLNAIEQIDLDDYPVLPRLTEHARAIFERGSAAGRDPRLFSKIGDSMTASENFLVPFGAGDYDLGAYDDLEPLIDFVRQSGDTNAFNRTNYATALGFTTASALDSTWADADACQPNETPLDCEFRSANPAFALIMFGTNDVIFFDPEQFDYFLRLVILETIEADVVPILSTFPIRPEEPDKSLIFNQIIIQIAEDYDLPLINLLAALEPLPNYGVDLNDTLHLTEPEAPGSVAYFDAQSLQAGYTVRNLVVLQSLSSLLNELGVLEEGESS